MATNKNYNEYQTFTPDANFYRTMAQSNETDSFDRGSDVVNLDEYYESPSPTQAVVIDI